MRITTTRRKLEIEGAELGLARTTGGVIELWAADDTALALALGFCHAYDRGVQLLLQRLIAQGRVSEVLKDDEVSVAIDAFMRRLGLYEGIDGELSSLSPEARRFVEAYATGVSYGFKREGTPWELRLVRYRPEPWQSADCLATIRLMSYLGLAQTQQDIEKLIIQAMAGGVDSGKLRRLFAPHLDSFDHTLLPVLSQLAYLEPLVPPHVRFLASVPRMTASNSWAVAPSRSETGSALQCNDPHLEVNRLPGVWYEAVMHTPDDYRIGITMPGIPGVVMGRTSTLSFGFSYGFMDMVDYFVEEVQGGRCRRSSGDAALSMRCETIRRKHHAPLQLKIYTSSNGVLETDVADQEPADGYYLARAYSGQNVGAARSLEAMYGVGRARTVSQAQAVLREVSISCNWVLADREGNIGYQQSGLLPARRHSGLFPVPGWDDAYSWQGLVPAGELHSLLNPPEGVVVTANDELNPPGGPLVVNCSMGPYRADRIREVLLREPRLSLHDMKRLQLDLYSVQAERFMQLFAPHLPDSLFGRLLKRWDLCYDKDSRAATLFEELYHAVLRRVFGRDLFGLEAWDAVVAETPILADYYAFFDRILLDGDPRFFPDGGRDAVFKEVVEEVMHSLEWRALERWGKRRRTLMTNILFQGSLPRFLGFDHGPVELEGNRATVVQGGLFIAHGRRTTFCPSWRYVTDLGTDSAETVLAGGPSGRRLSRHYRTDVKRWLRGGFKRLHGRRSSPRE